MTRVGWLLSRSNRTTGWAVKIEIRFGRICITSSIFIKISSFSITTEDRTSNRRSRWSNESLANDSEAKRKRHRWTKSCARCSATTSVVLFMRCMNSALTWNFWRSHNRNEKGRSRYGPRPDDYKCSKYVPVCVVGYVWVSFYLVLVILSSVGCGWVVAQLLHNFGEY